VIEFVRGCTEEQWRSAPLDGDPRPVAVVVVDHVADAYGYLAGWLCDLVAGKPGEVDSSLSAADLAAGDSRAERFAQIAIRHADDHRTDIEAALAAR
jgi:hypothetical protein